MFLRLFRWWQVVVDIVEFVAECFESIASVTLNAGIREIVAFSVLVRVNHARDEVFSPLFEVQRVEIKYSIFGDFQKIFGRKLKKL